MSRRNRRFNAGEGVHVLDVPVISVGNITMGGTGKTPLCGLVIRTLKELGHNPALAMRGYRASRTGGSDEAAEYLDTFPDLPISPLLSKFLSELTLTHLSIKQLPGPMSILAIS